MGLKKDGVSSDTADEAAFDTSQPGFHVMDGKTHLGTYPTEEDAQAFIDGHANDAKIVEGGAE